MESFVVRGIGPEEASKLTTWRSSMGSAQQELEEGVGSGAFLPITLICGDGNQPFKRKGTEKKDT
jgi:hypothetical protein